MASERDDELRIAAALLDKYDALARLRRDATLPDDERAAHRETRDALRALAFRHPGALRELDQLALETIALRRAELREVIDGTGALSPWMRAQHAYHRWMRVALALRREGRVRTLEEARSFLATPQGEACREAATLDDDRLAALVAPPSGSLVAEVLTLAAHETGLERSEIARWVRPGPRPDGGRKSGGTPQG